MKVLFSALVLGAGATAMAYDVPADALKVCAPVRLVTPMATDSTNVKGEKFEVSSLLSEKVRTNAHLYAAEVDTAGFIVLPRPSEGLSAYIIETSLRPARYTKGKLEVTGDAMFAVNVNGARRDTKKSVQDSIDASSVSSVALTMNPEKEYAVKVMVIADASAAADPRLKLAFTPDAGYDSIDVAFTGDGKRRFEIRDLTVGCRVSGVSVSPDGKYMIIRYLDRFSKDKSRQWATLTDLQSGKVINDNLSLEMQWMPRGSRLYYTATNADGYDVVEVQVPSMREKVIMENVPERRFSWSPAEDYIVYYTTEEADKPGAPLRRYTDPDDRMPGNRDRSVAMIMDRATGVCSRLTFGNRQSSIADIAPDGRSMVISVSDYDATQWPFYFTSLYTLELGTMRVDTLLAREADIKSVTYSPDGKRLFVVGGPDCFGGVGRNIGNHEIANAYDGQGFIYDIATGQVKAVTRDFNPSIDGSVQWNRADGRIYFGAENGFDNSVYCYDPDKDTFSKIPQEIGYIQRFSIGDDEAAWLAYYGQGYNCSGRAYLYNIKKGTLQLVADPWSEVEEKIDWGRVERRVFTASDGTEIEGFITFPPQYDPDKKYPMIVYYYGGTSPTQHNTYSQYNPQLYASRDYIVYQLNPSGTTGYGQEFSARHVNTWGQRTADDIIEGVTSLCEELPSVDADKIGCIGASYGGFMTQYLQTLTDIFACAVAHAGISNVTSYWGEGYWGYSYNAVAAAKSYPWNNPELFTTHGSLFNADKIHTPLLLTHGTGDTNVPVGESIQLYNALKILGREVELVTADGEDHYISGADNRLKWQDVVMAWFARWLQDQPQWWEDISKEL